MEELAPFSNPFKQMTKRIGLVNIILIAVFVLIFCLSLYLKLFPVLNNNFPFTMDQARDMLDLRSMVELKKPALIGPTTSINGVFLGPFYYYFNLVPYLVSGGNPTFLMYWNLAWYLIGGAALFVFFYKKDRYLGLISSVIFLMAPAFFYSSRYFWNANLMPYITAFYFLAVFNFFRHKSYSSAIIAGLLAGLSMQVEAAFGILFFPFFLIFTICKRTGIKYIAVAVIAFAITLLPQIFFELRHNFVMSKTFISEVTGKSQILGEKLSPAQIPANHYASFVEFSDGILGTPKDIAFIVLLISIIFLVFQTFKNKLSDENKIVFLYSGFFIIFAFCFYLLYSYPLKGWFLLGLRVPYILIISLALSELLNYRKVVSVIFIISLLGFSFMTTYLDQIKFIPTHIADRSGDKSNLRNEIEAIDWVYQKANGKGFKAYNYIPSVYDFPYQYLYWWHGGKTYGYHPEVLTYLDGVPEYIQDNDKFQTLKKPTEDSTIFMIYEKDESAERLNAWLGNFTKYCPVEKIAYDWGTTVELRRLCPSN